MKTIIYLFLICFLFSCNLENNKLKDKSDRQSEIIETSEDSCINSDFYEIVNNYVIRTKGYFEGFKMYYTIYFFKKNNVNYFTMWAFNSHPDYIEITNPKVDFEYANMQLNNETIYVITNKDDTVLNFISPCENLFNFERIEIEDSFNYDGSWHIETYEYYLEDNNFVVKKLNSPIVDFLGDVPKEFY